MPQQDILGCIAEIILILGWLKHAAFDLSSGRQVGLLMCGRSCHVISWGEGTVSPTRALWETAASGSMVLSNIRYADVT